MRTRPAFTRSIVAATALASTLTFSGCTAGADDDASAGGDTAGTSQQPPAVTPEEETAGEPAEEAGDGPAAGALPADFPAEVPVIDGPILMGHGMDVDDARTWTASIGVDDSVAAMDLAREQLLAAGFEETGWTDASAMRLGSFTSDHHQVVISNSSDAETGDVVGYQVGELEAGT